MITSKEQLRAAVASAIGLKDSSALTDDLEWDSLDHLSVITSLRDKHEMNLSLVGDLSEASTLTLLADKLNIK